MTEHDQSSGKDWDHVNEEELVEAAIDLIMAALRYRTGYLSNFTCVDRNGGRWSDKHVGYHRIVRLVSRYERPKMIAYTNHHAMVHVVNQYRKKVNTVLREQLGGEYRA